MFRRSWTMHYISILRCCHMLVRMNMGFSFVQRVLIFLFLKLHRGIMQDYYLRKETFPGSNVQIKLTIVGALYQVLFTLCIFSGNLLYPIIGFRALLISGITLTTTGLLLSSLATAIWQLYLTFSLCTSLGVAFNLAVAYRLIPQWFVKYRSTVSGIYSAAIPFSGLVFPVIITKLNNSLGPSWTYRILGLIYFALASIACPLVTERDPSLNKHQKIRDVFDFSVLRNVNMVLWIFVGPIQAYAAYITFTFLPSYATSIGLPDYQGALLITIISAGQLIGSIIIGAAADKFGDINAYVICITIASASVLLQWMFAHSFAALVSFAVVHGLVYGCYFSVTMSLCIAFVGMKKYPSALSFRVLIYIISIFGPMVASYLETINTSGEPYFYSRIVAGSGYAVCAVLGLIIKFRMNHKPLAKV
ncbi:major facilitator superfamily domain-containing protein [Fennellomyces sp. T-0311]|nr:major facilitator superfamily domain-containing protein [Fennellomyces sp. T-0311]